MAAKRVMYFKRKLEDKPGALLAVAQELKGKNLGVVGAWGMATAPGEADLYVYPKNPDKLRAAWKAAGVSFDEGTGIFLKGTDKTGALVKSLESLAHAGINIVALEATAVGGKYGSFVWVAPADVDRAAKALGAK